MGLRAPFNTASGQTGQLSEREPSPVTQPAGEPGPGKSPGSLERGFVLRISLAQFGLSGSVIIPSIIGLPVRVQELDPQAKIGTLSFVLAIGAVVGMVAYPLGGRLSDRTRVRFGRRRPWLLIGAAATQAGLLLVACIPSIPVLVAGWVIAMLGFSVAQAALYATVFDQVPFASRSRVTGALSGALTLAMLLGAGVFAQIPTNTVRLLAPPIAAVVLVGYFALTMRDAQHLSGPRGFSVRGIVTSFWTDVSVHRDFGWVWLSRALVMIGIMAPPAYYQYFLASRLDISSQQQVSAKVGVLMMSYFTCTAVATLVSGWLSDRLAARKPFIMGSSVAVSGGLALLAVADNFPLIVLSQVVLGLGGGMFYAVDLALVTDVMPVADEVGKDFGVMNLAIAVPQILAPALAAMLLRTGGGEDHYTLYFAFLATLAVLGIAAVSRVRNAR